MYYNKNHNATMGLGFTEIGRGSWYSPALRFALARLIVLNRYIHPRQQIHTHTTHSRQHKNKQPPE